MTKQGFSTSSVISTDRHNPKRLQPPNTKIDRRVETFLWILITIDYMGISNIRRLLLKLIIIQQLFSVYFCTVQKNRTARQQGVTPR